MMSTFYDTFVSATQEKKGKDGCCRNCCRNFQKLQFGKTSKLQNAFRKVYHFLTGSKLRTTLTSLQIYHLSLSNPFQHRLSYSIHYQIYNIVITVMMSSTDKSSLIEILSTAGYNKSQLITETLQGIYDIINSTQSVLHCIHCTHRIWHTIQFTHNTNI